MEEDYHIVRFLQHHMNVIIYSTSAEKINLEADIYNVKKSTNDPEIDDKNWKELLIHYGINRPCYVTNQKAPTTSSHNGFDVGGHMTTNTNGIVKTGGISYLMPLCKWHNHPARNNKNFEHDETEMLLLRGFMQGDTALTFLWRMFDDKTKFKALVETAHGWKLIKQDNNNCSELMDKIVSTQNAKTREYDHVILSRSSLETLKLEYISKNLKTKIAISN